MRAGESGDVQEGITKFTPRHTLDVLPAELEAIARQLDGWRTVLVQTGLVGQDPRRYAGLGFGNVSARVQADAPPFLITGTQTGAERLLELEHFCLVTRWNIGANHVESSGETPPSSESLTHAAFYEQSDQVQAVFHGHAPEIWSATDRLGLPASRSDVAYGTTEMAREVERLSRESDLLRVGVMVMRGHEDGVVSIGASADEAGSRLIATLARARGLRQGCK